MGRRVFVSGKIRGRQEIYIEKLFFELPGNLLEAIVVILNKNGA
jgi:hypothetical protein